MHFELDFLFLGHQLCFPVNIVLNKPAYQISTEVKPGTTGIASNSNDGDFRTNWATDDTCAHTEWDDNAWWAVDLLRSYTIDYVTLTNRLTYGKYIITRNVCYAVTCVNIYFEVITPHCGIGQRKTEGYFR